MKKQIIIVAMLMACSYNLTAQSSTTVSANMSKKFVDAMETNLKILDTAKAPATFIMLANNFERIGKTEQKQWQPFYHSAFCYAVMALNSPDKSKVDLLADKADSYLASAAALQKDNSEISTLKAMIIYARILVDPVSRWQTMSNEAADDLAKAKQADPANPRPYLIEARTKLHTPENLGGGPKAARPIVEECLKKYNEFVPENSIAPNWGKAQAEKLMQAVNPQ